MVDAHTQCPFYYVTEYSSCQGILSHTKPASVRILTSIFPHKLNFPYLIMGLEVS